MKKFALFIVLAIMSIYSLGGNFYVNNGGNVQQAINNASDGDTIFVKGHHDEDIFINKSIKIEGMEGAFIRSIEINCSNVSIDNITTYKIIVNGNDCILSNNFISQNGMIINGNNCTIYHNFISNCSAAVTCNGSNCSFFNNGLFNNSYGMIINGNNCTIYHNNFVDNAINAIDNDNNTWYSEDLHEGNYWYDYNGTDANNDGIGDVAYTINASYDNYPLMQEYDIYPPSTHASIVLLNGSIGNNGWYIGNVSLILNATDESQINHTFYRINNGSWNVYQHSINFTSDGIYLIEFYSVDVNFNYEMPKNVTIKIDKTKPLLNYTIFPPSPTGKNGWYNTSVEISLNAMDDFLDSLYYKIDNGTWRPYNGYPIIPDGIHTIYFKAVDKAGNYATDNVTLKIDTQPPSITIQKPNGSYVKNIYEIEYNATDEVDSNLNGNISIYYSYDNGSHWQVIAKNLNNSGTYQWNTHGFNDSSNATIKIVAEDDAGNVGIALSNTFILDNTPPSINITSPKSGETFGGNETIEITWNAYDTVDHDLDGDIYIFYYYDGAWYYIVNGTENDGEYIFSTSGLDDGEYRIKIIAIDDAGNVGTATTGNFTIDRTPPSVYISKPLKGFLYVNIFGREMLPPIPLPNLIYNAIIVGKITVEIEVSDQYSGVQHVVVSTDEAGMKNITVEKPYQWLWNPSFGVHWLKATAWDNAGNMNSYELDNIWCINI